MRGKTPLPENADQYWVRPSFKDKGNDSAEPLWQAIGASVTAWEFVEETFAHLFRLLVESKSIAADRAYGAIASSRGRRDAIEAAAEVFFTVNHVDEIWKKEFRTLMSHFGKAGGVRNEIAHGVSIFVQAEEDNYRTGIFLFPADYNTRKTYPFPNALPTTDKFSMLKAKYRYTSEDINQFTVKFHALNLAVTEWTMNLRVSYLALKNE